MEINNKNMILRRKDKEIEDILNNISDRNCREEK